MPNKTKTKTSEAADIAARIAELGANWRRAQSKLRDDAMALSRRRDAFRSVLCRAFFTGDPDPDKETADWYAELDPTCANGEVRAEWEAIEAAAKQLTTDATAFEQLGKELATLLREHVPARRAAIEAEHSRLVAAVAPLVRPYCASDEAAEIVAGDCCQCVALRLRLSAPCLHGNGNHEYAVSFAEELRSPLAA